MRTVFIILLGMLLLPSCKKDPPKPPEKVLLTAPAKNSECTPIQTSSPTSNEVRFSWQPSNHTESYELRVTNLNTNVVQTKSTRNTVETLSLQKGTPFSWVVISKNSQTEAMPSSESWLFYNPGSQLNYAPFPAEIVSPRPGSTVFKDINNEVALTWSGADVDNDIESYEIYFSTNNPPENLIDSPTEGTEETKVSVESETVYYWKVMTIDAEGNTSDSGVVDFRIH